MASKNEAALCDRVIAIFEKQLSAVRADVTYPENDKSGPPVEMRRRIGETRFAFEHTRIEQFERHIQSDVDFEGFSTPLRAALDGTLPNPGTYNPKVGGSSPPATTIKSKG